MRLFLILSVLGMEACWLSPWARLLGSLAGVEFRPHMTLAVYLFLLVAFFGEWAVSTTRLRIWTQRLLLAGLVLGSTLGFVWIELYAGRFPFSLRWMGQILVSLSQFPLRFPPEALLLVLSVYVWYRSLMFGEASMLTEMASVRFHRGFLAFALYSYVALIGQRGIPWEMFAFFFLGVTSSASARLLESELGPTGWDSGRRWLGLLLGAAALTLIIGAVGLLLLSPSNLAWAGRLVSPLFGWVSYAFSYLIGLAYYVLEWFIGVLVAVFSDRPAPSRLGPLPGPPAGDASSEAPEATWLPAAWNVGGRVLAWALLILAFAWLVGRVVRRRRRRVWMGEVEHERLQPAGEGLKEGLKGAWQRVGEAVQRFRVSPRYSTQDIRRVYASLVAYAGQAGFPRDEAQTPFEFQPTLENVFPQARTDIELITNAYVRTHYGQVPESADELTRVRESWERLRETEAVAED
jgi:hypothetical protein